MECETEHVCNALLAAATAALLLEDNAADSIDFSLRLQLLDSENVLAGENVALLGLCLQSLFSAAADRRKMIEMGGLCVI